MAAVAGPAPAQFDKGHQKRRGAAQPGVYTCFIWPKGREKGNDTLSPTDAVAGARRNHQGLNNRRSQGKKKKRQKLFNQTAIEISVEFRTGQWIQRSIVDDPFQPSSATFTCFLRCVDIWYPPWTRLVVNNIYLRCSYFPSCCFIPDNVRACWKCKQRKRPQVWRRWRDRKRRVPHPLVQTRDTILGTKK